MQEIILALISQLNSSVFILLAILILAFISIFKMGKWTEKFTSHDRRVEKIEGLSEKVIELKTKIDLIYQYTNPHPMVKSMSPISLTELGKKVAEEIKANQIFSKYVSKLVQEAESKKPTNAYDIQQVSLEVSKNFLTTLFTDEELNIVKQQAFKRGVLVEDIMIIFGIILRNHILQEKGIPISDIDKHSGGTT